MLGLQVGIDVLPGESQNIVDVDAPEAVTVAILGSPELDAASIDPLSLRLMGAPTVKNDGGTTHRLADVNGDGIVDLTVWFSARDMRLGDNDTSVRIEGRTRDGIPLEGK